MLKQLMTRYHFARALLAWNKGDYEGCLDYLSRNAGSDHPDPFRAAFRAQSLLALGHYPAADEVLSETIRAIGTPRTAGERYIQIACLLWKQNSFRDLPEANRIWAEALTLDCPSGIKRYILLREPPEFRLPRPETSSAR